MINHKFSLGSTFQEIFYRLGNWINEGSGWIVELIEFQNINFSTYRPLSELKKLTNNLNSGGVEFPVREKLFSKGETKNNICISVYCYGNKLTFPIYISNQEFQNSIDLLLATDENKSHYEYIKDFDRFMFHKTKNKNKKYFWKSCLQCFSIKN